MEGLSLERTFTGHDSVVNSVAYAPGMKQAFSGGSDGSLMLWNFRPQLRSYRLRGHSGAVTSIAVSPDEGLVVSASIDHTIRLWTPSVKGTCNMFKAHAGSVLSVDFSDCAGMLLSSGSDKMVKLWDITGAKSGKRPTFLWCIRAHNNWVRSVHLSQGSLRVASGGDDKLVKVWDTKTCKEISCFSDHSKPVKTVRFDPLSGVCVASGSEDGTISLGDFRSKQIVQHYALKTHASVNCIRFHPSGNYLLSASSDCAVRIWDLREGRLLYTVSAHSKSANACEFSVDGNHFISGGADASVLAWNCEGLNDCRVEFDNTENSRNENGKKDRVATQKAARASMSNKKKEETPDNAALKHIALAVQNLEQRLRMNEDAVADIQHNHSTNP